MEAVIPPRGHKSSTDRYTWDENGKVSRIQVVNSQDLNTNRQTVQWPFQNMLESETGSPPSTSYGGTRRATWQPAGLSRGASDASSGFGQDVIPDYVANYIRGETPETLARKKQTESNWRRTERGFADVAHAGYHTSRVAEPGNWFRSQTSLRPVSPSSVSASRSHDEQTQILPPGSEKGSRASQGWPQDSKGWRRLMTGWRGGIVLNILLSFLILLVGLTCLILAISEAQIFSGQSTIYNGSCKRARDIDWGILAIINVFIVVLIAGSNYVFQVLSSPTRDEVAVAHGNNTFLDIGLPSWRNLKHISNTRVFIILSVLLSAVITQTIYNSVVFVSQTAVAHDVLYVTQSFLEGAQISNGTTNNEGGLGRIQIENLQGRAVRGQLTNITSELCFESFNAPFQTEFDAVILVTDLLSARSSLIQTAEPGTPLKQDTPGRIDGNTVLYCLAQASSSPQSCAVMLNGSMLGIVALLNLISVIAVALSLTKTTFEPLVTLGDAIASFIEHSDPSTRGSCLMTKSDAYQTHWGQDEAKYWIPQPAKWFSAPSIPVWFVSALTYTVLFGLVSTGLVLDVLTSPQSGDSLGPFGQGHAHSALVLPEGTPAVAAAVLAALPHFLLAVLYFSTNSLLTSYFLSRELALFAVAPHTLRVSARPRGGQTTSLFLTLPRPCSWALLLLFSGLGFVLSQSVFVVQVAFMASSSAEFASSLLLDGEGIVGAGQKGTLTAIGISGVGMLGLLVLLVMLALLVGALGFGRAASPGLDPATGEQAPNPLVLKGGSCSAVIAARCQSSSLENDLSTRDGGLQWGVLRRAQGMNVGHCGFSAQEVGVLEGGKSYS